MNSYLLKLSHLLTHITFPLLALLLPLFFLPTTPNFYDTNKQLLATLAISLIFISWLLKILARRSFRFTITPFTLPLVLLALVYIASSIFRAPNPIEAFMGRGSLIPVFVLMFITLTSTIPQKPEAVSKLTKSTLTALVASATILSFVSIFQAIGLAPSAFLNQLFGLNLPTDLSFNPAGAPLAYLTFTLPLLILTLLSAALKKDSLEKLTYFILSAVITAGLIVNVVAVLPGKDTTPILLPFNAGWSIAIDSFKDPKTALLGFGPETFVNAFTRYRPSTFNLSPNWNLRFGSSSNEPLHIVTTVGLLGLAAWLFLVIKLAKNISLRSPAKPSLFSIIKITTLATLILQFLLPANPVSLFLTYLLVTLWALQLKSLDDPKVSDVVLRLFAIKVIRPKQEISQQPPKNEILPFILAIPLLAAAVYLTFLDIKAYAAEMMFKRSFDAAAKNDGTQTYNLQRDAILTNPYVDRYRRSYATTNLALANTIASQPDLSDQDRSNVTQLIQQAIREAKNATTLDGQKTANWETLATVYRNLINVASGADQWTVASYVQAIQTDPVNPQLRLELGGVYYALGQYDQSIRFFQQAAELKPDWANAFYNLSAAYREKQDYQSALTSMQQVLNLIDKSSADYAKAQAELNQIQEKLNLPQQEQTQVEEPETSLTTPTPAPSPVPGNRQIRLPEDVAPSPAPGPEAIEQLPASSPTPNPSPTTQP